MILLKIIKRGLVDLPIDLWQWIFFYYSRSKIENDLKILVRDGFQTLHGIVVDADLVLLDNVGKEIINKSSIDKEGQLNGRAYCNGLIDPRLNDLIEKFKLIAAQYFGSQKIKLELTYFQISKPEKKNENVPGGNYHLDDNKPNLKFFVYLTNVGPENGPLNFIPGSHGLKLEKLKRYLSWTFLKRRKDLYGDLTLMRKAKDTRAKITGSRGLSVAVDTTGWHRADPVIKGQRYVFVASFNYQ